MLYLIAALAFFALVAYAIWISDRVKDLERAAAVKAPAEPVAPVPDPLAQEVDRCREDALILRTDIRSLLSEMAKRKQAEAALNTRVTNAEKAALALPAQITTAATNAVSSTLYRLATSVKDPA